MLSVTIIMASKGPSVGGMEKQVALQANHLVSRHGIRVTVLCAASYVDLFSDAVSTHIIPCHYSRFNPLLTHSIQRILKDVSPQIVHAHGHKAANILARMSGLDNQIKTFGTAHGTKKNSRAFAGLDYAIAVSEGVSQTLAPTPATVLPNAIERYQGTYIQKEDLCARFQMSPQRPLFIAAGRLAPVKRYDALMKSFHEIDANLLVFGEGALHAQLTRLETSNIKLAGFDANIQQYFGAADALVISSEREGFSLSMIEALSEGLPVISTPGSGTQNLIPQEATLSHDPSSWPKEFDLLIAQRAALKCKFAPVFEHIRSTCTPEAVVARLTKLYYSALEED